MGGDANQLVPIHDRKNIVAVRYAERRRYQNGIGLYSNGARELGHGPLAHGQIIGVDCVCRAGRVQYVAREKLDSVSTCIISSSMN